MRVKIEEELARIIETSGDYRVLRRLPVLKHSGTVPPPEEKWKRAIVVDTETTGLDTSECKIIEIALQTVYFSSAGKIKEAGAGYVGLQDPGEPLSDDVKRVTGFDDMDLVGQSIDWMKVGNILLLADVIIAHNAAFDRPILERHCKQRFMGSTSELSGLLTKSWACSMAEIPWKERGAASASLGVIATHLGYFFDAHRAFDDVNALVSILALSDEFAQLLTSARMTTYRVSATGSPFSAKDLLKARGYHWDADGKVWFKDIVNAARAEGDPTTLDIETQWLAANAGVVKPTIVTMTAKERYK